jgi:hypothetical protein
LILDFEFDQHLESHKHVINIIMGFRDMGCYIRRHPIPVSRPYAPLPSFNWPPSPPSTPPCCRTPPPHRWPTPLVSRITILLARWLPLIILVLTPLTALRGSRRRALAGRTTARVATARWPRWVSAWRTGWHGPAGHCAAGSVQQWWASGWKDGPVLYINFLTFNLCLLFQKKLYNLQKCIENTILLRKIQDKFMYTP